MSQPKVWDAIESMLTTDQYRGWLLGKTLEQLGHLEVDPPERLRKSQQLLAELARSYEPEVESRDDKSHDEEAEPLEEIREGLEMFIEQTLGKALGYPKYTMSPEMFPECPADSDMVCIGDNDARSLAEQAAKRITNLQTDPRLKLKWGVFVGDTLVMACATESRANQMAELGRQGTDPALGEFSVKFLK